MNGWHYAHIIGFMCLLAGSGRADGQIVGRVTCPLNNYQQQQVGYALSILTSCGYPSGQLTSQGIAIVTDTTPDGRAGKGDADTICLDVDSYTPTELAVIINHEY